MCCGGVDERGNIQKYDNFLPSPPSHQLLSALFASNTCFLMTKDYHRVDLNEESVKTSIIKIPTRFVNLCTTPHFTVG